MIFIISRRMCFNFSTSFILLSCFSCAFCFFTHGDKTGETGLDVSECSWCVKQLSKEIISKIKNTVKDESEEVELRIRLHKSDIDALNDFVNNEDTWIRLEEVLKILHPAVLSVEDDANSDLPPGFSPWVIILMSVGCVTLCAMWMILSRQSTGLVIILLLLLVFSVGLTWNWWKIYNEEYSRRVMQLPDECKPDESSWYHSVKGFLIDPNCGEYFKAPVDDPVAMVSPHQVITETISMIFISPISMAASTFSTFIHTLTGNLIWPLNWIVQILLSVFLLAAGTVLCITILAGMFNLDMKFSTCLVSGELKPSKQRPSVLRLPSQSSIKKRAVRPTDLALFPNPPSPFR